MDIKFLKKTYFSENYWFERYNTFTQSDVEGCDGEFDKLFEGVRENCIEMEQSTIVSVHYCLCEIMGNVMQHSKCKEGFYYFAYDKINNKIKILVADDGIGIASSLKSNPAYKNITDRDALSECIKDEVTDGTGKGFGLYATSRLVDIGGLYFEIYSGEYACVYRKGSGYTTEARKKLQGTLLCMEIDGTVFIDPNKVVDNRTDPVDNYNTLQESLSVSKLW